MAVAVTCASVEIGVGPIVCLFDEEPVLGSVPMLCLAWHGGHTLTLMKYVINVARQRCARSRSDSLMPVVQRCLQLFLLQVLHIALHSPQRLRRTSHLYDPRGIYADIAMGLYLQLTGVCCVSVI